MSKRQRVECSCRLRNARSLWKSSGPMMFDLILDVMNGFLAKIGSIVPLGRGYFPRHSSTSCLATIVLSLRDKNHSTIEAPRIESAFMG